jgi:hypothetical protein
MAIWQPPSTSTSPPNCVRMILFRKSVPPLHAYHALSQNKVFIITDCRCANASLPTLLGNDWTSEEGDAAPRSARRCGAARVAIALPVGALQSQRTAQMDWE